MYSKVQFEFNGFKPERKIKNFIKTIAQKLHLNSPSDSAMKVVMSGTDAIKATCHIASQAGTFVAEVVSETPSKAIKKIEENIEEQLVQWRKTRFL